MLTWYLARGAGLAAFAALSVATGVGAYATRRTSAVERRVVWQYVHRAAALSGVALLALHIVTLLIDPYAHVGVRGLLPLGSGYRPLAVTFGVVAAYLIVLVALTGVLRSRLTHSSRATRRWRALHLASYLAWASAAWHFWQTGTDSGSWWARGVLLAGGAVVACGVVARVVERPDSTSRPAAVMDTRTLAPVSVR